VDIMTARPWKVIPGFSRGRHGGITFDNAGTGIPTRSFATEAAARRAATHMVCTDLDPFGQYFAAVRVTPSPRVDGWDIREVDEYEPWSSFGGGCIVDRLNVVTGDRTDRRIYRTGAAALEAIDTGDGRDEFPMCPHGCDHLVSDNAGGYICPVCGDEWDPDLFDDND
jgi:hypothetical protein